MNILGLNAFHGDSSAALVRDGKLVAAAEEERFRRVKHWAGFPSKAIAYCLREAGLQLGDVQHIAVNQDSRANLLRKIRYLVTNPPEPALVLDRLRNRRSREKVPELLTRAFPGQRFRGHVPQYRTSSRASLLRLSRVSLRARRSSSRSTASAIFRVRPGAWEAAAISPPSGVCTSPIRSASSTRP